MEVSFLLWVFFLGVAPLLLAVEFFVIPRGNPLPLRTAAISSAVCLVTGLAFGVIVGLEAGETYAIKYETGFLIEKGLTVDQVLVFALFLHAFAPPRTIGRRLVYVSLLFGLLMRIPFIVVGSALGESSSWVAAVAVSLAFFAMATLLLRTRHHEPDPSHGWFVRHLELADRIEPVYRERSLHIRRPDGAWALTLGGVLLVALLTADLFFAGAVPIGFSYGKPGILVFASSVFALLGFRSMFYVVANLDLDLGKLKVGLATVFVLVGIDVLVHPAFEQHKPTWFLPLVSFVAVALPLGLSVRGTRAGPPAGFGDGLGGDGPPDPSGSDGERSDWSFLGRASRSRSAGGGEQPGGGRSRG